MNGDNSRGRLAVAGAIVVLIGFYIFSYQSSSRIKHVGSEIIMNRSTVNNNGTINVIKRLPTDIPGGHDIKDIDRPPRSSIVWQQSSKLMGLGSKTVKYITFSSPEELQRYFTDKLAGKYAIIRDSLTIDDGLGWSGLFLKPETDELITIFSTSKRLDLPAGGAANPTMVSIMKVRKFAESK